MKDYTTSTSCLLCGGSLKAIQALGETPLANELQEATPGVGKGAVPDVFPLTLVQCAKCQHLQLDTLVNETRMYSHYLYVSDTGPSNQDHFRWYAQDVRKLVCGVGDTRSILDIGSNDGLFLSYFKEKRWRVLGVDPSNIADLANEAGIPTFRTGWNEAQGKTIAELCGTFDVISCNNCFAHTADLHSFVRGIKHALADGGTFVLEVSYAMALLEHNLFDMIYHEHIHYWTLTAAQAFFAQHGMVVYDVQRLPTHGGSIRMWVSPKHQHKEPTEWVRGMLREEKEGLAEQAGLFADRVIDARIALRMLLGGLTGNISLLGYPAKACTLSTYCGLSEYVADVFDDNPLKIGRCSHEGQEILPTSMIAERKPDYLLIMSWNYADHLMYRHRGFGGQFIVPLPEPRIA